MSECHVVTISGSPSAISKSSALGDYARHFLELSGLGTRGIRVRDLPALDLIHGNADGEAVAYSRGLIAVARGVVILTPVYKSSYSGLLKTFLDLLPPGALAGKTILPVAVGGTGSQLLAVDYALKPVLAALGGRDVLPGVYAQETLVSWTEERELRFDPELKGRFHSNLAALANAVHRDLAIQADSAPREAAAQTDSAPRDAAPQTDSAPRDAVTQADSAPHNAAALARAA